MRIKGKEVYVYDIEVFPNCFHCSIKNVKSKERLHYEISSRKNDLLKLVSFFTNAFAPNIGEYSPIQYFCFIKKADGMPNIEEEKKCGY